MNTSDLVKKYGGGQEQKQLLSRMLDLIDAALSRHRPGFSYFMTPADRAYLTKVTELGRESEITFEGGYSEAERSIAVITPPGYDREKITVPIAVLALDYKGERLGHRDILGALMGLGIKRERVGDIIDTGWPQLIICDEAMAEFIILNLTKIGRMNTMLRRGEMGNIPEREAKIITATAASLRLDSVLAESFGISRSKATDYIKRGCVHLNWLPAVSCSKEVSQGDRISLRGFGKIELTSIGQQSRKGRTFINISRY